MITLCIETPVLLDVDTEDHRQNCRMVSEVDCEGDTVVDYRPLYITFIQEV